MTSDEKHIQEIIKICKDNGKEIDREHAINELERMRSIAHIIVDTIMKMTPEERKEIERKMAKKSPNNTV